jgi:transposase
MMGSKTTEPKLFVSFDLDAQVPRHHVVRRIAEAVDFGFVRDLARPYYSHTGQPSVDPVVLFKLSLLGYLYRVVSERQLCEEAGLNLAWRWFLGYELEDAVPDHSVLSKARRRFGIKVYEQFFARVVQLCEVRGLIQGQTLFVDSTLVEANASRQSMRARRLVKELGSARAYVHQVWHANAAEPADEDDGVRRTRPGRGSANRDVVSRTDPDAQMVSRRGQPPQLAHKAHIAVDGGRARVVTAVMVRPATEGDGQATAALLDRHEAAVGRATRELVADRGYTTDDTQEACVGRGVQPVLATIQRSGRRGAFPSTDFEYIAEHDYYRCPAGQTLRPRFRHPTRRTTIYAAAASICAGCPLKAQCAPGKKERRISRRWNQAVWDDSAAFMRSRRGRQLLRRRSAVVEPRIGDLKIKYGLTRAQFRGRRNLQIQSLLTAAALNLKALARWRPVPQAGWAAIRARSPSTSLLHAVRHAFRRAHSHQPAFATP